MTRAILASVFLLPLAALAQSVDIAATGMNSLSIEQLCEMRASPDAWVEIEQRGVFRKRELRSIEKEQIRAGITQEALTCFMGAPPQVLPVIDASKRDPVDAFLYPLGESDFVVVHIRHGEDESVVVRAFESELEAAVASNRARGGCGHGIRPGCTSRYVRVMGNHTYILNPGQRISEFEWPIVSAE